MGSDCGNSVDLFSVRDCSVSFHATNEDNGGMTHLTFQTAVTLLGAAPVCNDFLDEILARAPELVAADGGARTALAAGRMPDAVIGDFDSLDSGTREAIPADRLIPVSEQATTDFEKCIARISAPLVLALGFTGRRLDHELAVYNALVRHAHVPCIVLGRHDLVFAAPPDIRLGLDVGTRVSLFPLAAVRGGSQGLRWAIGGLDFAPWDRVGTSNRATGPVELRFDRPGMLVILPRTELEIVAEALATSRRFDPAVSDD